MATNMIMRQRQTPPKGDLPQKFWPFRLPKKCFANPGFGCNKLLWNFSSIDFLVACIVFTLPKRGCASIWGVCSETFSDDGTLASSSTFQFTGLRRFLLAPERGRFVPGLQT